MEELKRNRNRKGEERSNLLDGVRVPVEAGALEIAVLAADAEMDDAENDTALLGEVDAMCWLLVA